MMKKERAAPGSRQEALMAFLRKEMVGDSLLLTGDLATRVAEAIGTNVQQMYGVLKSLEKKGSLKRDCKTRGKGIEIRFVKQSSVPAAGPRDRKPKEDGELTIAQVLANLDAEIEADLGRIEALHVEIHAIGEEIERKKCLRSEITRLGGRN